MLALPPGWHLARTSPLSVRIEKPEGAFGEVRNEIRSWLDSENIYPVGFRSDNTSGALAFDVRFAREHEARLFQEARIRAVLHDEGCQHGNRSGTEHGA